MANIKSQKKRALTNLKKNSANTAKRTQLKNSIKAVLSAVEAKDLEAATKSFDKANSLLDKALTSNIKHANYVARQKARLQNALNTVK